MAFSLIGTFMPSLYKDSFFNVKNISGYESLLLIHSHVLFLLPLTREIGLLNAIFSFLKTYGQLVLVFSDFNSAL